MKKSILSLLSTAGAALLLSACAGNSARVQTMRQDNVSQEIAQGIEQLQKSNAYQLQPGDLLQIKVFMEDNLEREQRISGSGSITFPLVGNIRLAGYTTAEAEARLSDALKTYLKNPQVSMLIKEYGNKTVYVLGQVQKPAAIEIPPEKPLTVLEAITSVGGFTDIAATGKVRVLRMENGAQKTLDVDVTQITKQGNKMMDIPLLPGDVVFVPQSMF
ncbi:MAG: polysaccharide export protein [Elusimicrobia bacterium]|nr:polysaccharide export protein [Elusimicrobiota bacterium]